MNFNRSVENQDEKENDFITLKEGYDSFDKSVLLVKDNEGYTVYSQKYHQTYNYGSDLTTAENHYNSLINN